MLQMILEDGRFGESIAQTIISQVARGLKYMHSMGVIHRDMKMENLMLANKGDPIVVKLCDFGLSCFADDPERLTNAVGTPRYVCNLITITTTTITTITVVVVVAVT